MACCRCCSFCCACYCSATIQKIWVFGLGTLFLAVGLVNVIWWPTWAMDILYNALPLSPTSRTYDKWAVTPIPVYMHMYLFNWTNPELVRVPGIKPHFDQIGPYVYREVKSKEDIVWHENKTVSFYGKRTWYFEPDMSGGTLEDLLTVPHLPSIAASSVMRNASSPEKFVFNIALNRNGGALYQTHTASEWLFDGFYDQFLDFAMKLNNSQTGNIESNQFAWFLNRNGSKEFEGYFTIHTGRDDLREMGEIKFWKGMNHTGFYDGNCGRINGSTADLWVPNRGPEEFITIYITDTCRIINLEPTEHRVVIEGVEGVKYETKPNTFDNGQLNSEMKCYCPAELQPDNCPKSGATDLGPCAEGVPMYLSHANFMYADPSYANTITGMNPDYEKDNFFIIMEPKLGIPIQVNAAVQVSLYIQKDNDITILSDISDFYAPLFVTSSKAIVNKELAKEIRFALNLPSMGRNIGIAMVSIGGVLIIIGIVLTMTRSWRGQRNPMDSKKNVDNTSIDSKTL